MLKKKKKEKQKRKFRDHRIRRWSTLESTPLSVTTQLDRRWKLVVLKRTVLTVLASFSSRASSASEAVKSATLSLESVHHVHGRDRLSLGVLGVGDCVSDDVLEENLEDAPSFFVDETRYALHATATSETTNGRLGDSLDVVPEDLTMAFGTALAETLSSFAATGHVQRR